MKYTSILLSKTFAQLRQDAHNPNSVYILVSGDKSLNREVALTFANAIICDNHSVCGKCDNCVRFELGKHPDILQYDKRNLYVADANEIVDKSLATPLFTKYKIFILHNAEALNEQAQNKLLKTLEEPNASTMFILTTSAEYKLLPTILSRGRKIYLNLADCLDCEYEFGKKIDHLTDYENSQKDNVKSICEHGQHIIDTLDDKAKIPEIVAKLNISPEQRTDFLKILYQMYKDKFRNSVNKLATIHTQFDTAVKRLNSNVNFNYIMDCLLINIT